MHAALGEPAPCMEDAAWGIVERVKELQSYRLEDVADALGADAALARHSDDDTLGSVDGDAAACEPVDSTLSAAPNREGTATALQGHAAGA
jgi:hypothetical protein